MGFFDHQSYEKAGGGSGFLGPHKRQRSYLKRMHLRILLNELHEVCVKRGWPWAKIKRFTRESTKRVMHMPPRNWSVFWIYFSWMTWTRCFHVHAGLGPQGRKKKLPVVTLQIDTSQTFKHVLDIQNDGLKKLSHVRHSYLLVPSCGLT